MTTFPRVEFDHLVQVVRHKALGYRAECWCGWSSAWATSTPRADEAGADHREVGAAASDGMDATLSGLLDLQDDLADTVIWLAENWSSDLPVPHASRGPHRCDDRRPRASAQCACWSTATRPSSWWSWLNCWPHRWWADPGPDRRGAAATSRPPGTSGESEIEAYTEPAGEPAP